MECACSITRNLISVFSKSEFVPSELFRTFVRYWYVVLFAMIVGGLLAFGFTSVRPAVYEASTFIHVAVDKNRALALAPIDRVQALDQVRALIVSDDTLQSAIDWMTSNSSGPIPFESPAEFRSSVRIAQREAGFSLIVYDQDADQAAAFANAWARASVDELKKAFSHAIKAADIQSQIFRLGCALQLRGEAASQQAVWICGPGEGDAADLELPGALVEEVMLSRGILPSLTFSWSQAAEPQTEPIRWARSEVLIAGLALGLLTGLIAAASLGLRERPLRGGG